VEPSNAQVHLRASQIKASEASTQEIAWDLAPLSWTFRVLCCPPFKRNRRAIAERRLQPALGVVPEVLRQRAPQCRLRREGDAARELDLERVNERFGARVVARAADARTLRPAMVGDERTEGRAHVLRAAIAVEDQAARWPATRERTREHATGLARRAVPTEGPRQHAAGMMIEHDAEIAPAVSEAEIRDVADPPLVVPRDGRAPHPIRMLREPRANPRLGAIAAHGLRA